LAGCWPAGSLGTFETLEFSLTCLWNSPIGRCCHRKRTQPCGNMRKQFASSSSQFLNLLLSLQIPIAK
jgi:hypothetical protein